MVLDTIFRPDFAPDREPCPRSRAEALAEFKKVLDTDSPKLKVIEISGDRWSGKTMVLQDFAELAVKTGWRVAAGSATSSRAGTAFGAFGEALNELIDGVPPELRPIVPPVHVRWLAEIFPALETSPQPPPPSGPANPYQVLNAIRKLIETLCAVGDLVLLFDDMHWADEATIGLLAHLLRYPPKGALVIVLAHRPRQSGHNLGGVISAAAAHGVADRMALAPLDRADALALLPDDFSSAQCSALLTESGGNPGLLRALAGLRIMPGRPVSASPRLPDGVMAACLRDFRTLSALGRLVAQAAAVLDEPFEPDMLKVVAQIDDTQVRAGVDELVSEDLVCSERHFPRLRFVNPLLRAAAYQSAGYGWLAGAQARAAELFVGHGKPSGQVAGHLVYASATGDEASARFLLRAARENLCLDPAQAAFWVTTAADLHPGSTANEPGGQLLLGQAFALSGRLTKALKALEDLTEHDPGNHHGWAEAVSWRAWVRFLTGQPEQSRDELTAALSALPPNELDAAAELRQRRLIVALEAGTQPTEDDEAGLSSQLARTSGMPAAELSALLAATVCHRRPEPARRYATAAAESFAQAADDDAVRHVEGLYWLAQAQSALGDHEAALACCERGVLLTEQRQIGSMLPQFAAALARFQLSSGDLNGAARHAACALTAAALTGSDHLMAIASAVNTQVRQAEKLATVMREEPWVQGLDDGPAASPDRAGVPEPAVAEQHAAACSELDGLSGRELQVAMHVSQGRTNEQIARRLGLSSKTVETYLARIFKKLTVSCRAEVATMVGRSTH